MDEAEAQHIDKGKGRAKEPTERTPLLGSTSTILNDDDPIAPPPQLRRKLTSVFLVSLWICILGFIGAGFFAWSYASRASNLVLEDMVVFAGPDQVDVRNMTSDVMWVNVKGRIGLDVGNIGVWKWVLRRLDKVSVELSTVRISAQSELVRVDIPPLDIPLTVDPPNDKSWLTEVEREIRVQVVGNRTVLEEFVRETWSQRFLSVHAVVDEVHVGWKTNFKNKMENIRTNIRMKGRSFIIIQLPS